MSPYFPPSTLAGVHRARHLAKHLPAAGWNAVVVCVDELFHEQTGDPGLAALVPPSTEIVKVPAVPAGIARTLGVGDIGLRAWWPLRDAVRRLIGSRSRPVVMITGGPFYPMIMAPGLRAAGVPVVLDFQDPWISTWGAAQPAWSKVGVSHRLASVLEPIALRGASYVTSVSQAQNEQMAARYPWLDAKHMEAIPIGGDPEDFDQLRRCGVTLPGGALQSNRFNLSFVGTFMPRSGALVRLVLMALARLRQSEPGVGGRIAMNFIGTSNQPNDCTTMRVMPLAQEAGVADAVSEIPQRLPFLQALAALAQSDGVLLIGSDEPHYTASKIYPALMSGRPFLSLFHAASSSHQILLSAGGGITHVYRNGGEETEIVSGISASLQRIVTHPDSLGRANPAAYAPYEARAIARRYASIFESAREHV